MSILLLLLFVGVAWLLYPIAGGINVAADVAEGKRPKDAGFSFLPEIIVFPATFIGMALIIDSFLRPWGSWGVAGICVLMILFHVYSILINVRRLRKSEKSATSQENH